MYHPHAAAFASAAPGEAQFSNAAPLDQSVALGWVMRQRAGQRLAFRFSQKLEMAGERFLGRAFQPFEVVFRRHTSRKTRKGQAVIRPRVLVQDRDVRSHRLARSRGPYPLNSASRAANRRSMSVPLL